LQGYCIAIAKPRRKVVLASYCNNILNHKTKGYFLKYLFYVQHNMPYILIQINEGIAKFFTLMEKVIQTKLWSLNAMHVSSWDICIHHET
jgi:hypothetical protein